MTFIEKLRFILDKKEKLAIVGLLVLVFFGACMETIGLSLIIPYISLISDPNKGNGNVIVTAIKLFEKNLFNISTHAEFVICTSLVLITIFIFKNVFLFYTYLVQYRFLFRQQVELSNRMFKAYLEKPYVFHLNKNSAELIRNVNEETRKLNLQVIRPLLLLSSECMMIICVCIFLIYLEPFITGVLVVVMFLSSKIFLDAVRGKTSKLGKESQAFHTEMFKWVAQGLGGIKEIKILKREPFFLEKYVKSCRGFMQASLYQQMTSILPKLYLETMTATIVLSIIVVLTLKGENVQSILGLLAVYGIAAIRVMPSITNINSQISTLLYYKASVDTIYTDLFVADEKLFIASENIRNEKCANNTSLSSGINISNIGFKYPGTSNQTIENISISIPAGSAIGIVGTSGVGKTTLVDLILGILTPSEGIITSDGININDDIDKWSLKLGYIPQNIYLMDDTIRNNIAFGIAPKEIADEKMWDAIEAARLTEFVKSLDMGVDTIVGDKGVRLSGGQRQRIGIARALYNNPEVLVLDEATSALDNTTEGEVMEAISSLKGRRTIIMVAHRLSTLKKCEYIYDLSQKKMFANTCASSDAIQDLQNE